MGTEGGSSCPHLASLDGRHLVQVLTTVVIGNSRQVCGAALLLCTIPALQQRHRRSLAAHAAPVHEPSANRMIVRFFEHQKAR